MSECTELELVEGVPVVRGTVEQSTGDIQLDRVPIVTPNCDIVVPSLSIQVFSKDLGKSSPSLLGSTLHYRK